MKWTIKSFIIAIAAVCSLTSCEYDDTYTPAPATVGSETVYFEKTSQSIVFDANTSVFSVKVCRLDTTKAETYKLTATSDSIAYFDAPSTVSFEKGDSVQTVTFKVAESFPSNKTININFSLQDDEKVNIYSDSTIVTSIALIKEDYLNVARGTYTNQWDGEAVENVVLQYSESLDTYRLINPYGTGFNIFFKLDKASGLGNETEAQSQTGFSHPSYGIVFTKPAALTEDGYNIVYQKVQGAEKLNIGHNWCVSAGSFGANIDTYDVTSGSIITSDETAE